MDKDKIGPEDWDIIEGHGKEPPWYKDPWWLLLIANIALLLTALII